MRILDMSKGGLPCDGSLLRAARRQSRGRTQGVRAVSFKKVKDTVGPWSGHGTQAEANGFIVELGIVPTWPWVAQGSHRIKYVEQVLERLGATVAKTGATVG